MSSFRLTGRLTGRLKGQLTGRWTGRLKGRWTGTARSGRARSASGRHVGSMLRVVP